MRYKIIAPNGVLEIISAKYLQFERSSDGILVFSSEDGKEFHTTGLFPRDAYIFIDNGKSYNELLEENERMFKVSSEQYRFYESSMESYRKTIGEYESKCDKQINAMKEVNQFITKCNETLEETIQQLKSRNLWQRILNK